MPGSVLILGGRSDIGLATAHVFAAAGHNIQLAARHAQTLSAEQTDLAVRYGVNVDLVEFDALDTTHHEAFAKTLPVLPDIVICAVGVLGNQAADEKNLSSAIHVMRSNYEGPSAILSVFADLFEARGSGTIVGISSVAGDRGRATNYIYGSAKAGFTAFLSGLRNRLARKGVHVLTVLPGFVATRMTEQLDLPKALTAEPKDVALAIERAVKGKRNTIYVRPVWALIMLIIRSIPEAIFKRLRL